MLDSVVDQSVLPAWHPDSVQILAEPDDKGMWSVCAYLDGAAEEKRRLVLATCETKDDVRPLMHSIWRDLAQA